MKKTIALLALGISLLVAQNSSNEFSYALKLYNQKFYDLSARQFIKYYNRYPGTDNVDEARFYAGMSLYNLKEFHNARVEFQALALEYPSSSRAPESWFKIADCYIRLKKPFEAAKAYQTIKNLYPKNDLAPEALLRGGLIFMQQKMPEKARSIFLSITDRYPGSAAYPQAQLELALIYKDKKAFSQAVNSVEKALQSGSPKDIRANGNFIMGEINRARGFLSVAEKRYQQVIKTFPKTEYAQKAAFRLGEIALKKNNHNLALSYFQKVDPHKNNRVYEALGDAYFLKGSYKKADEKYGQALKLQKETDLFLELKHILVFKKLGQDQKAADALQETISGHKLTTFTISKVYITYLLDIKDFKRAVQFIKLIFPKIKDKNHRYELTNILDDIYLNTNAYENLIQVSAPLVQEYNRSPFIDDINYKLARAYEIQKKYALAAQAFGDILSNYPASSLYASSLEKLSLLKDYYIINSDRALRTQGALLSRMISNVDKGSLLLELGLMYYNDLKDYELAESQFESAANNKGEREGDAFLYWGRSLKKEAYKPGRAVADRKKLLEAAAEKFKSAVLNKATVTHPDQASWEFVQTRLETDTVKASKEKDYIETLIKKYPDSPLQETWHKTLAFTQAFSDSFAKEASVYFKYLVNNYKGSPDYALYLLNYSQLITEGEPVTALAINKEIVFKYANSPQAAIALYNVAHYYEKEGAFENAAQLYTRLQNEYYYSPQADIANKKIGAMLEKAGRYSLAIEALGPQVQSPFLNDPVLARALVSADVKNNVYYLAKAYRGIKADSTAIFNYTRYLSIAPNGTFRNNAAFDLAEMYYNHGDYALALDNLKQVSNTDTLLFKQSRLYMAGIYFKQGAFDAALPLYKNLLLHSKSKSDKKEFLSKYILCEIRLGKVKDAEKEVSVYKRQFEDDKEALAGFTIELGNYYRIHKNFKQAIKLFKRAKSKYDDTGSVDDAVYYLALTDITLNKHEDALDILTSFPADYPRSDMLASVYNSLGAIYFRGEKYENAIASFKNALNHAPDNELKKQVMSNLIKTYTMTGFWDAAQNLARGYVHDFPGAEDVGEKQVLIAQAYINLNQYQKAVDYLRQIKKNATSEKEPEIQFYIGDALLKAGRYEEAIAAFVKIPLMSRKTKLQWEASALYYSGQAYEKLGRIPDAIRMYEEIINRPGIDLVLKRDAKKRIGQIKN